MEEAVEEGGRGRWSAVIGLTIAVLLLAVFDALALVLLPFAILMVGWPEGRGAKWVVAGVALWVVAALLSMGGLSALSRGWGLMLGATYLLFTLARPTWTVISRALAAVGVTLGAGALGLLISGRAAELERMVRSHFDTIAEISLANLQTRIPEAGWLAGLQSTTAQLASLQADIFPALLALQSIAALALASWWIRRIGRSNSHAFALHRLRDFRFNDQLIWVLISALALLLLPLGEVADRIAINGLVFMVALYALRGLAVFVFLATGSRSIPTMLIGAVALIVLYPVAFTAALLMGVGDTWLDVRRRVASTTPT